MVGVAIAGKRVLLDADIIAFSAACSAEKRFTLYKGHKYPTKKELYVTVFNTEKPTKEQKLSIKEDCETLVEAEPASHSRQNARMLVGSILDACAPLSEYRGWITGPGNFRYEVATIQPYKGNRDPASRPIWLGEVHKFLMDECNTEMVEGIEADDRLAIEFMKDPENSIIASQDKDFMQLPNLTMWDWKRKEWRRSSPVEAIRAFYTQLLTGDSTDYIQGVVGLGEAKAEKILGKVTDERTMTLLVYGEYKKAYGDKGWSNMLENGRLLFLLRDETQLATPKTAWIPCITP